jgi:hypothetical protein
MQNLQPQTPSSKGVFVVSGQFLGDERRGVPGSALFMPGRRLQRHVGGSTLLVKTNTPPIGWSLPKNQGFGSPDPLFFKEEGRDGLPFILIHPTLRL